MCDPREVLRAAGVEVPKDLEWAIYASEFSPFGLDAVLTLARLVARYRWQRDELLRQVTDIGRTERHFFAATLEENLADLDRRWVERNALAASAPAATAPSARSTRSDSIQRADR
jgi:hypothetical protein